MTKWIFVTFQVEGFHHWPGATRYPQHYYLSTRHRHTFHFRVDLELLETTDREIEFIEFKRILLNRYTGDWPQIAFEFNDQSCEEIAAVLGRYLNFYYPNRRHKVEVSEDGENGSVIES